MSCVLVGDERNVGGGGRCEEKAGTRGIEKESIRLIKVRGSSNVLSCSET